MDRETIDGVCPNATIISGPESLQRLRIIASVVTDASARECTLGAYLTPTADDGTMIDCTRRRLIAAGSAAGLSILAGCADDAGDDGDPANDDDGPYEADDTGDENGQDDDGTDDEAQDVDYDNPAGSVSFVEPGDGDTVESPFTVEMEVSDFELVSTDDGEIDDDTGHLHVLVDSDPIEPGDNIPEASGYLHLDDGDTEAELDLSDGEYDLVAQAGDSGHIAFDLVDEISITVENGDGEHDPAEDEAPFPQDDENDDDE